MLFPALTRALSIGTAFVSIPSKNCHLLMLPAGPVNFFSESGLFFRLPHPTKCTII